MKLMIAGSGNVASHLGKAFVSAGHEVAAVNPRTLEGAVPYADAVIISVSDSAIAEVARHLAETGISRSATVAHTSGSVGSDVLAPFFPRHGVLYPLQTFSRDVPLDYAEIPFFVTGNNGETEDCLKKLAESVSQCVRVADDAQRVKLHIAAVFACNFTNYLWGVADEFLRQEGLGMEFLAPLVKETLRKASSSIPAEVQTGPARRGDMNVVEKHLDMLAAYPEWQKVYALLSESIHKKYNPQ